MQGVSDFLSLVWDAELMQLMLLACPDGVVVADGSGKVILYTGASEQIFGYSPIEVLRKDIHMLLGKPEIADLLREPLARDGTVTLPPKVDEAIARVNGGMRTLEDKARAFLLHVTARAPGWYASRGPVDDETDNLETEREVA